MRDVRVRSSAEVRLIDAELIYKREQQCWAFWNALSEAERSLMVRTVESEMQRLGGTVANWFPAAAQKVNGNVQIVITLTLDEIGVMADQASLSSEEKAQAALVMQELAAMVESLEES